MAYLKRAGFLSTEKRGEWKIEKHIPELVVISVQLNLDKCW
jgi:hypothetical protein